jgi:hypothetical protein
MKTQILFNTRDLIKSLNSLSYNIEDVGDKLKIVKKYANLKGRPFSIILPRKIQIYPEAVGLIVGEGYIGNRRFVFANSNKKAISEVCHFLEQFNLPFDFYLELSVKNKSNHFIYKSKFFWENHLKIKLKRIRLRKEFNNITLHGTIHVGINNSLVAKLLRIIIEKSKKAIEKSSSLSKDYLKGILAAEGNINIKKKTKCVYMVRISASKTEEREHYKRCLDKVGIKVFCKDMPTISKQEAIQRRWKTDKGRAGAVIISRWENFIKILQLGLLDLSRDKEQKFRKYFINNKFTRQFLDFKSFIGKEFTMKQAQNYFNLSGRSLNRVLSFLKKGYISRRELDKKRFIYKLTKKYISIYDILVSHQDIPIS